MSDTSSAARRAPSIHTLRATAPWRGRRALLLTLAAVAALLIPSAAFADTPSTLTVVGTSDVSDSGLIPNVIQPDFAAAYPTITFKYVGSATGTAIQNAESGNGGPSALIVHAASLENQFVADGFSYNNQYGNAIFTNDFVVAGPTTDPAGVGANGGHNVAQAFADIAAAGVAGKATFLTRGGSTTASGTTVEEHAIWALVNSAGLSPAGVVLCTVSAADGGGMSPIKTTVQSASGAPCPDAGTVVGTDAPSWYYVNTSNQAANVIATNACTVGSSGANSCYTLSDRGTYDYLASGTSASAGTVGIPSLAVVSADNSATAPGGQYELVNYFHVYIINPAKPGEAVNLTAAQNFVKLLTAQSFQTQLKTYLPASAGGPPFAADASPNLTTTRSLPRTYRAGKKATVTGTVVNAEPGYPPLAGVRVSLDEVVGTLPVQIASAKTTSTGAFTIRFVPPATGDYQLATAQIAQVENATLSPVFGDILSPAASAPAKITVDSAVTALRVLTRGAGAVVAGTVAPGTGHNQASVSVYARANGTGRFTQVGSARLGAGEPNFAVRARVKTGTWQFKVKYQDPGTVVGATSKKITVTVGSKPPTSVSVSSVGLGTRTATVKGSVRPKAAAGGKAELLALRLSGGTARFGVIARATVKAGKSSFSLHARLRPTGEREVLEVEYLPAGSAASYSGLRTIKVR